MAYYIDNAISYNRRNPLTVYYEPSGDPFDLSDIYQIAAITGM